jgi:putative PIN family toxin of toxin-antitoxin system
LLEVQSKLENKFGFERALVVTAINDIRKIVTIVHTSEKITVARDPDDDKIIECAIEANAEVILPFDKDLLDMKEYRRIKMVHPSALKYWFSES